MNSVDIFMDAEAQILPIPSPFFPKDTRHVFLFHVSNLNIAQRQKGSMHFGGAFSVTLEKSGVWFGRVGALGSPRWIER